MTTSDGYIDCCAEFRDCWRTDGGGKEEEKGGKRIQERIYAQVEKCTKVRLDISDRCFDEKEQEISHFLLFKRYHLWQMSVTDETKSASIVPTPVQIAYFCANMGKKLKLATC